jgi:hypothetical protein
MSRVVTVHDSASPTYIRLPPIYCRPVTQFVHRGTAPQQHTSNKVKKFRVRARPGRWALSRDRYWSSPIRCDILSVTSIPFSIFGLFLGFFFGLELSPHSHWLSTYCYQCFSACVRSKNSQIIWREPIVRVGLEQANSAYDFLSFSICLALIPLIGFKLSHVVLGHLQISWCLKLSQRLCDSNGQSAPFPMDHFYSCWIASLFVISELEGAARSMWDHGAEDHFWYLERNFEQWN